MKYLKSIRLLSLNANKIYYEIHKNDLKSKYPKLSFRYFDEQIDIVSCLQEKSLSDSLDLRRMQDKGMTVRKIKHSDLYGTRSKTNDDYELYTFDLISISFSGLSVKNDKNNNREVVKNKKIREDLYINGFDIDKVGFSDWGNFSNNVKCNHYVRYKRTSGASRDGNCLFIRADLFDSMEKWSRCDLPIELIDFNRKNKVYYEAYKSLSLTSIISTVSIEPKNILILKDAIKPMKENCVNISKKDKKTVFAEVKEVEIKNNIFDGEGLLDCSIFNSFGSDVRKKGMMLLRNKFFKSCVFNTNLKKFFDDNKIKSIEQLNGIYDKNATIDDIKLVVTDSSIKYLNFFKGSKDFESNANRIEIINTWLKKQKICSKNELSDIYIDENGDMSDYLREVVVRKWLSILEPEFGIVKLDKKTKFFNGEMVRSNYQFINTLNANENDMFSLYKDTIELRNIIRNDENLFKFYLMNTFRHKEVLFEEDYQNDYDNEYSNSFSDEEIEEEILDYDFAKYKITCELIDINKEFVNSKLYQSIVNDINKKILDNTKIGKILFDGTNATIFGNGYELLKATIDNSIYKESYSDENLIKKDEVICYRFKDGENLTCFRSPHITMGNIYIANNKNKRFDKNDVYTKYFNLSKEIVCVNAINNNIQQRLNGCDYDSDVMFITDNSTIYNLAKKDYLQFLVPYNDLKSSESSNISLANIDYKIQNNKIGEIVNLSQNINSILWNSLKKNNNDFSTIKNIYEEICKLAVLSNVEIDKAKKDFDIDIAKNLEKIRNSSAIDSSYRYQYQTKSKQSLKKALFTSEFFKYVPKKYKNEKNYFRFNAPLDSGLNVLEKNQLSNDVRKSRLDLIEICNKNFIDLISFDYKKNKEPKNYKDNRDKILKVSTECSDNISSIRKKIYDPKTGKEEKKYLFKKLAHCFLDSFGKIKNIIKNQTTFYLTLESLCSINESALYKDREEEFVTELSCLIISFLFKSDQDLFTQFFKTKSEVVKYYLNRDGEKICIFGKKAKKVTEAI